MFWDAVVFLIIAKVAVMLFEDAAYAVRGMSSPRLQERARRREAERAGQRPSGLGRRSRAAVGDYVAGLLEDGAQAARASRRRRLARKRGRQAVNGILVDVGDDARWYADCDVCGWSSRPYAIEANARLEGVKHACAHRDDDSGGVLPTGDPSPSAVAASPTRPRLTVIPGGADPDVSDGPTSVVHDKHTYCLTPACSTCRPPGWAWDCRQCGQSGRGFATEADARADSAKHPCTPDPQREEAQADMDTHIDENSTSTTATASNTTTKEKIVNLEATGPEEIRHAFAAAIEAATERAEETGTVGAVLVEAADRYESLEMAASTVAHIREAGEQFSAAQAALNSAVEDLESALADFNARDGQVAETIADAGNLASREVLLG